MPTGACIPILITLLMFASTQASRAATPAEAAAELRRQGAEVVATMRGGSPAAELVERQERLLTLWEEWASAAPTSQQVEPEPGAAAREGVEAEASSSRDRPGDTASAPSRAEAGPFDAASDAGQPVGGSRDPAAPQSPVVDAAIADAVWGRLPPRERADLIRAVNEKFIPQYSDQIRDYLTELARRAQAQSAERHEAAEQK